MTPPSKESQRAELHKTIWRIANDLRGSVDGWDFKSYVLGMLFYRYISENLTAFVNEGERAAGHPDFDYRLLSDEKAEFGRKDTVNEKGFYILPSELFANVRQQALNNPNLNETLERVFKNIESSALGADSEDDIKGLFDDLDVNSSKLGNTVAKRNEKLVKLLDAIGDLPLGNFQDHTIDLFGDAYEYLMTMYASQAGKSGGEFFTPQEVSELLARLTVVGKTAVNKVYDPACGSGSLLLKFAKVLGKDNVRQGFFGQEVNLTTYNLARINMFLHDVSFEQFDIAHGDTLTDPQHLDDEPFEAIVSNPPYSIQWDGDSNPLLINDTRYAPAGVLAPKSKADLAFTMHILSWLAVNGTAAIVEFPGVLYRGGAERKIRQYLIDNNYVDAVIQLPPDLFFGTGIATCIIVLKKSKKDSSVLFVDASSEFVRQGNKNKLTPDHQRKILDLFTAREDVDHFTKLVSNEDIGANDYNISVSSYVEQADLREVVDIDELNAEIARIVVRQQQFRAPIDEIVADLKGWELSQVARLTEEFCPGGVRFRPLGEVLKIKNGKDHKNLAAGDIPVYGSGGIMRYVDTAAAEGPSVLIPRKGSLGNLFYVEGPFWVVDTIFRTEIDCSVIEPKFIYYQLSTMGLGDMNQAGGVPSQTQSVLNSLYVPVPPLEVQREVVRVLDHFAALDAELLAELSARRVQYAHYRDKLLTFERMPA